MLGHERSRLQLFMSYAFEQPFHADLELLVELGQEGMLHARMERTASLADLAAAVAGLRVRRVHGEVVINLG